MRRGIQAVDAGRYSGALRDLADQRYVTPPAAAPGPPPSSKSVAPLEEILRESAADRGER